VGCCCCGGAGRGWSGGWDRCWNSGESYARYPPPWGAGGYGGDGLDTAVVVVDPPRCESEYEEEDMEGFPAINCSSKILPCVSLWVAEVPDREDADGGVGTCCGLPWGGRLDAAGAPPSSESSALCRSTLEAVDIDGATGAGGGACSSLEVTGVTGPPELLWKWSSGVERCWKRESIWLLDDGSCVWP
jgi:hypothetical protein